MKKASMWDAEAETSTCRACRRVRRESPPAEFNQQGANCSTAGDPSAGKSSRRRRPLPGILNRDGAVLMNTTAVLLKLILLLHLLGQTPPAAAKKSRLCKFAQFFQYQTRLLAVLLYKTHLFLGFRVACLHSIKNTSTAGTCQVGPA